MKVTFDFATQRISIDGDGPHLLELLGMVREIAPKLSHIQISANNSAPPSETGKNAAKIGENGGDNSVRTGVTLKQFVRQLNFENLSERIAAIGYYYKQNENRDTFSPKDMETWFTFASFQKPAQMSVAINDAARKHGYVESGGYGKWRLTTQGENIVTHKLNLIEEQ